MQKNSLLMVDQDFVKWMCIKHPWDGSSLLVLSLGQMYSATLSSLLVLSLGQMHSATLSIHKMSAYFFGHLRFARKYDGP
jgi:hypothetical protein